MRSEPRPTFSMTVRFALAAAARKLPAQAPLSVFIATNTLEAYQDLPFHEAARQVSHELGVEPYLSEDDFRGHLARGRIDGEDLDRALAQFEGHQRGEMLIPRALDEHDVRMTLLHHGLTDCTEASLDWLIEEEGATRRLHPGLSQAQRERLLETGARTLQIQRDASTEVRVAQALHAHCEAVSGPGKAPAAPQLVMHRQALLAQCGEDIYDLVLPVMIRWCAAFTDDGLASWPMPGRAEGFYRGVRRLVAEGSSLPMRWRRLAQSDFRRQLARNSTPMEVVIEALDRLGVTEPEVDAYVQNVILSLPGWAGMMSRLEQHPAELVDAPPTSLLDYLAVRLTYELAAIEDTVRHHLGNDRSAASVERLVRPRQHDSRKTRAFRLFELLQLAGVALEDARTLTAEGAAATLGVVDSFDSLARRRAYQEAFELHFRRQALDTLQLHRAGLDLKATHAARPYVQLITCFDDREESLRRHLEELEPRCETFGAPGFFGAAIRFRALGETRHVALAPAVIDPTHHIDELPRFSDAPSHARHQRRMRYLTHAVAQTHDGSLSLSRGALLNVAFGLFALFPLVVRIASPRSAGRLQRWMTRTWMPRPRTELTIHFDQASDGPARGFKIDERVSRVATVLENIGLTQNFSKLVLVLGHGATTLNNPHASAYDCGACGGRQGGPNARAFAQMANDPEVRAGLLQLGIAIPQDTLFVGGQHDTCNEDVSFFDVERLPSSHGALMAELRPLLHEVRAHNAWERCRRLAPFSAPAVTSPDAALRHVQARAEHLAEPRPELSHQGHGLAVIGRRALTRGLYLDRRAFVLSYDPTMDPDGAILERSLAAAMPVGAGINLQYYYSRVDNEKLGSGSKLPHNVVGLLGVMTGHASDLRTGLPRQMVDAHEPQRLLVVVEATPERLLAVTEKRAEIRQLVVNGWVRLVSMDPDTGAMQLYTEGGFVASEPSRTPVTHAVSSRAYYQGKDGALPPAHIAASVPQS